MNQSVHQLFEEVIDESVAMQPMHPMVFDDYLSEGWRLLGFSLVRHNYSICRNKFCRTIPLRLRLDEFRFSKSQRQVMRRHSNLRAAFLPIALTPAHEALFVRHATRFEERRPAQLASFLGPNTHREPVTGMELRITDDAGKIIASSFMHLGNEAVSGTYCFFDPDYAHLSLGTYTMLLEIQKCLQLDKKYYYHGYCYDVPSQFDYKLNFNNLEAMNWRSGQWNPLQRVPVRRWTDLVSDLSME